VCLLLHDSFDLWAQPVLLNDLISASFTCPCRAWEADAPALYRSPTAGSSYHNTAACREVPRRLFACARCIPSPRCRRRGWVNRQPPRGASSIIVRFRPCRTANQERCWTCVHFLNNSRPRRADRHIEARIGQLLGPTESGQPRQLNETVDDPALGWATSDSAAVGLLIRPDRVDEIDRCPERCRYAPGCGILHRRQLIAHRLQLKAALS